MNYEEFVKWSVSAELSNPELAAGMAEARKWLEKNKPTIAFNQPYIPKLMPQNLSNKNAPLFAGMSK